MTNTYTCQVIRQAILEHTTQLRKAQQDLKEKTDAMQESARLVQIWEQRIADLQMTLGETQ